MILELEHVYKDYIQGKMEVHILKDISLSVEEGEYLAIMGPSGSGKTTLMNIIGCLDKPTSGSYHLNGKDVLAYSDNELSDTRLYNIGFVFQSFHLLPKQTALENVYLPLIYAGISKKERVERATEALERVGLGDRLHFKPTQLSGGQQQRVAIARALVNEPKVLLLDEPLGALDARLRKEMQTELKKIQKEVGITFVFVTHDQEEALSMSDTVVVMNEGTIQQIGTPIDIYNEPENRFVAGFIGESNIIEGVMIKDFLVAFDDFEFICVDKGFPENEPVDVVIRPEDIDIVQPDKANLKGIVKSVTFKGVHYETIVTTKYRDYRIDTTDYFAVGLEVGLTFTPEDIHVMWQMGSY